MGLIPNCWQSIQMNKSELSHLHSSHDFVFNPLFFYLMDKCWAPIMCQRLFGVGKTVETDINPRTTQMNGEWCLWQGPAIKGSPLCCGGLWCWIWPGQGWLPWADGVRAELCRLYQSLQSKGDWKNIPVTVLAPQGPATIACISFEWPLRATHITWQLQSPSFTVSFAIVFVVLLCCCF